MLLICIYSIIFNSAIAQSINSLNIGDTVPDFIISKIINSKFHSAKISDFNKQLLLLDFWGTGCRGCILEMPRMDSLQRKFGNHIKILPVTIENEKSTLNFWNKNKFLKKINLSSVVEDKLLSAYFKSNTYGLKVWIYKGKVIAITGSDYVSEEHIQQALTANQPLNWPLRNDFFNFNYSKPLLILDSDKIDIKTKIAKYSIIFGYKEGVNYFGLIGGFGIQRDHEKKTVRAYILNSSIYTAYSTILLNLNPVNTLSLPTLTLSSDYTIWEVKERSKYVYEAKFGYSQDWIRKNGFCFESLNPDTGQTDIKVYQTMIKDLDRLLNIRGRLERRPEKVWLIKQSKKISVINIENRYKNNDNISIDDLVNKLNQNQENPFVINESNMQISLPKKIMFLKNFDNINSELQKNGLEMKVEKREIDRIIFTEIIDF